MERDATRPTACILGDSPVAPFGLSGRSRLGRQLAALGLAQTPDPAEAGLHLSGACLFAAPVIAAMAEAAPGTVLADDAGRAAAARGPADSDAARAVGQGGPAPADAVSAAALAGRHDAALRKRSPPLLLRAGDRAAAERALFDAAYKGVTDLVTRHLWPAPALVATRACARAGITPNQVTWASLALTLLAFWLFWQGAFWGGLAAAWAMTFLDTVDGKLARVTLASSRFGDVLDHGLDLVHPPFWWWAWAVGCAGVGQPVGDGGIALGVIIGGYVLQRAQEGLFIARFGLEMHVWRRFDSLFREVTARRNPNLLILTVTLAAGAPREGLIAVAVWTALSLLVHGVRIAQAFAAARRGPLRSWLAAG